MPQRIAALHSRRFGVPFAEITVPCHFVAGSMTEIANRRDAPSAAETAWLPLMPGLFVVLWSTGFIGAKYGLPYADPLTFLAIRFGIIAALMLPVVLIARAPWPAGWRQIGHHALVGILIQGTYLGG